MKSSHVTPKSVMLCVLSRYPHSPPPQPPRTIHSPARVITLQHLIQGLNTPLNSPVIDTAHTVSPGHTMNAPVTRIHASYLSVQWHPIPLPSLIHSKTAARLQYLRTSRVKDALQHALGPIVTGIPFPGYRSTN